MTHGEIDRSTMTRRRLLTRAGWVGLTALVGAVGFGPGRAWAQDMRRRHCPESDCPYAYNPNFGDPTQGIPPGTPFEDLPDDWICPECGHPKYLW